MTHLSSRLSDKHDSSVTQVILFTQCVVTIRPDFFDPVLVTRICVLDNAEGWFKDNDGRVLASALVTTTLSASNQSNSTNSTNWKVNKHDQSAIMIGIRSRLFISTHYSNLDDEHGWSNQPTQAGKFNINKTHHGLRLVPSSACSGLDVR